MSRPPDVPERPPGWIRALVALLPADFREEFGSNIESSV